MALKKQDVLAYLARPWADDRRRKEEHWTSVATRRGPVAMLDAVEELRAHLRVLQPGWPSPGQRRADLEHHVQLKRLIDRYARAAQAKQRRR